MEAAPCEECWGSEGLRAVSMGTGGQTSAVRLAETLRVGRRAASLLARQGLTSSTPLIL